METKMGPKILTFYSNSLPLIFFLVFQGFDWRSGSVDPNPWSWMSGSIREGIGKDGCSERDQFFFFSRIQMRFEFRTNYRKSQSNIFSPLFIRRPYLFKFFSVVMAFILQEIETEDQEVGSKDGFVDAW